MKKSLFAVCVIAVLALPSLVSAQSRSWSERGSERQKIVGTYMDLGVGFRINHLDQVDADPLLSVGISRRFVKNASWQAEIEYRNRSRLNSNWEARTYGFNMAMVAEDHLGVIRPFVGAGLSWKRYDGNQWGQSFEETKLGVLIMGGFTIPVEGEASIQFGVKHIHNASTSYPIYAAEAATPPIREGDIIYYSGRNNLYNPTELFVKYKFKL